MAIPAAYAAVNPPVGVGRGRPSIRAVMVAELPAADERGWSATGANWRDLLWLVVSAVVGPVLLIAPDRGRWWAAGRRRSSAVEPERCFDTGPRECVDCSRGVVLWGCAAAPWMLRAYGGLARLVLAPTEKAASSSGSAYLA